MNPFSGSAILWSILKEYEPFKLLQGAFEWVVLSQNWSKMHEIRPFGHFFIIFTSKKIEMNPFSGSTIFWSILGEYKPFKVLCW